ncbi:MAG: hypothetical protein LBU34_18035 [Planctomycetaceae bacterium]|jgi:hypothetical protein|nr:hypothetical protein [Planctomycetaceae bacterium]
MKYGKIFLQFVVLSLFFNGLFAGCKTRENNQLSNPFALNRQTAPPPATFSHQASYLGQMPSAYVPQLPATTYPSGNNTPTPANVPSPAGTIPPSVTPAAPAVTAPNGSYGSINNSSGATLFQTSATVPAPTTENNWTAGETSTPDNSAVIAAVIAATGETVFQNLESKSHSVTTVDTSGIVTTGVAEPETRAVSSSPQMTQIIDDSTPQAVSTEPNSVYAGKYQ